GTGQIARQHLSCLKQLSGVEIAAVCDLSPSVAECAAERHGVAAWFTDSRKMLREVRPDVVHVTTPPPSHYRLALEALEAGALALDRGAIADFLPHLASLAHLFVGPHRRAHAVWIKRKESVLPYDEFRGLVDAERGTATVAFSAGSRPDAFWLRVYGERMQATANLFETRITFDRVRPGPKPLQPLLNGLEEGKAIRRAAVGTLLRKLSAAPGSHDGLFAL